MDTCRNINNGFEGEQALINKAIDALVAKKRLVKAPYRVVTLICGDTFKFRFVRNVSLTKHETLIKTNIDLTDTAALYRLGVLDQLLDVEIKANEVAA